MAQSLIFAIVYPPPPIVHQINISNVHKQECRTQSPTHGTPIVRCLPSFRIIIDLLMVRKWIIRTVAELSASTAKVHTQENQLYVLRATCEALEGARDQWRDMWGFPLIIVFSFEPLLIRTVVYSQVVNIRIARLWNQIDCGEIVGHPCDRKGYLPQACQWWTPQ